MQDPLTLYSTIELKSSLLALYTMTEAKGSYSTLFVNFVFNSFLSSTAVLLNIITIQALRKTPSLSKPLKTLLLSLAVSDLGVGFLVQPTYIAVLIMKI